MELTEIPEIGPDYANALAEAGIASVAQLAALEALEDAAARTGIHADTLDAFRAAARSLLETRLAQAGVSSLLDLVAVDSAGVAAATGLPEDAIARYRDAARAQLHEILAREGVTSVDALAATDPEALATATTLPAEGLARLRGLAHERRLDELLAAGLGQLTPPTRRVEVARPVPVLAAPTPLDRVVLVEGTPTGRVWLAARAHEGVRLVTLKEREANEDGLARATGNAIVLREGADVADVRVDGAVATALPLFRERALDGGRTEETRVRVKALRDQPVEPERKRFALFKRKA